MIRIVVLDGFTVNPGDLDSAPLLALGDCTVYDRTPPGELIARARDAEAILTNKVPIAAGDFDALPRLRYIGVLATGYNIVDLAAAERHGIVVTNIPAYSTDSVVQMVFAHILNFTQNAALHSAGVHAGDWERSPHFCYWRTPQVELAGKVLGIVGFGRIGSRVAEVARAFRMRILVCSRRPVPGEENVPLEDLLRRSDFVSLHCPLDDRTRGMLDARRLALMKRTAFLVNTGRGPLVDEQALADALESGAIAGAGVDVLSQEPPAPGNPLVRSARCCITPHIAWATLEARRRLMRITVENLQAFLDGRPVNQVRP